MLYVLYLSIATYHINNFIIPHFIYEESSFGDITLATVRLHCFHMNPYVSLYLSI
jgi:hypothetical protein